MAFVSDESGRRRGESVEPWTRPAYLLVGCVFAATVVWGFWSGYWGPLLAGGVEHFWFIHVHAAVFLGWVALVLLQAALVTGRRIGLHRRLGLFGLGYGIVVLGTGIFISIAAPVTRARAGQLPPDIAALVTLYNLTDILVFGVFFALAMRYRSSPALHRRLILCSGIALSGAAVGRVLPGGSAAYALIWLTPLILGATIDIVATRRLHPVFPIAAIVFAGMFFKVQLYSLSPVWQSIGQTLIGGLL